MSSPSGCSCLIKGDYERSRPRVANRRHDSTRPVVTGADSRAAPAGAPYVNALPSSGYLSKANRERESEESFVSARRAHPAIESAINGLEHRGLDRVRSQGADGFARAVALSVLAANLHRIGLLLQKRERKRLRRVA